MTLDLTVAPGQVESTCRRQIAQYTGPVSYSAGGETVTPADVRMGKLFAILGATISNGTAVRVGWYNLATGKLMWFVPNTGSEASGDLSAYVGQLEFVGQ